MLILIPKKFTRLYDERTRASAQYVFLSISLFLLHVFFLNFTLQRQSLFLINQKIFCIFDATFQDNNMKKLLFDALLLIFLTVASFWLVWELKPVQVKIMSYNVRHCAGMDLVVDYDRTANVIAENQPDVVALQELDSMTGRSGRKYQLSELANRTNYYPVFGKAIDYDGGGYGVGVLTKEKPLSSKRIPLPGEEPRVLLLVELKDYVIACTHLDLEESERLASLPLIINEAENWQKPFILAGDWNDSIDSPLLQKLTKYFTINSGNEPSFPADEPTECIDYVAALNNRPTKTLESVVIDESEASDHRPLMVKLQLPY